MRLPMRMRLQLCLVVVLALSAGTNLEAQGKKPGLSLSTVYDSPRDHAPIQLDAKLTWPSPDLLEGRLQLEFYSGHRLMHTWISREVVLAAGDVTLPVMAPPALLPSDQESLSVRATFVTDHGTYDLEIHNEPYWADYKRALVIGIVHPETASLPPADYTTPFQDRFAWVEPFRLDDALPHKDWSRHIFCRSSLLDPEVIPEEPLELTAFDLLIVTNTGLLDLNDNQLNALAAWAEAGGALCVAGERTQSDTQRSFLRRIADSSPTSPLLDFDADGNIRPLLEGQPRWLLASPGVGRTIVTFGPVDVRTTEWRRDVLKLWRVRPQQITTIQSLGAWDFPVEYDYWLREPGYQPLRPDSESDLMDLQRQLIPERVEGVPLPTVAILLAACLLAVAPGDYFLLGWLNRRRWTWVLFPAVAVGFSIFMVRLAQTHMGQADHCTTLTVVDLTRDGRAARTSRFELLFAASEKQIEDDLAQTLVVPLERRNRLASDPNDYNRQTPGDYASAAPAALPGVATGRVPQSYTHIRSLHQWSPRLARYTSMCPDDNVAVPNIDWSRLEAEPLTDADGRKTILKDIQTVSPGAQILLLHGKKRWQPDAVPADSGDDGEAVNRPLPVALAEKISVRSPGGMFRIVSQISPNAAGTFEDLTLLDGSDPGQWLLLIVTVDDGGNFIIYRRLIRDNHA